MSTDPPAELKFGVAGNPPNYWNSEFSKERANAPYWLAGIGLQALEIQCTYGVRMPPARADAFREASTETGVSLSVHAPYYVSLGNSDEAKGENSLKELQKAVELAQRLGSQRVVFHIGSAFGEHDAAMDRAIRRLQSFSERVDTGDVRILPEIDGRRRWLGSLEDVLRVCEVVDVASPCLDLAHLHARTGGTLMAEVDFQDVLGRVAKSLGHDALRNLHFHMYPIDWGPQGEIGHKAFGDHNAREATLFDSATRTAEWFYPRYEPMIDALLAYGVTGTIICEAKDSQDVGASLMSDYYHKSLHAAEGHLSDRSDRSEGRGHREPRVR